MTARQRLGITLGGALSAGLLATGVFSASPVQAGPTFCGAHEDPSTCSAQSALPTSGEFAFLTDVRYQRIPGDDARLLATARSTCNSLEGGVNVNNVVPEVAARLGLGTEMAGQVVDSAVAYVCPGAPLNE